jgi:hypothetical protein
LRVEDITAKIQQETAARYAMWDIWNSFWKSDTWKQILGKIGYPSIHMKQMENPWMDFHEIRFWELE